MRALPLPDLVPSVVKYALVVLLEHFVPGCAGQQVPERPILVEADNLTGWSGRPRPCQTGIDPGND